MTQQRNFVVAEARFGLSLILCLLLVLGYVVLQRLGGTGDVPPIVVRTSQSAEVAETIQPPLIDTEPRVLTAERWQPTDLPIQTPQRPEWLSPHESHDGESPGTLRPLDTPSSETGLEPLPPPSAHPASHTLDSDPIR